MDVVAIAAGPRGLVRERASALGYKVLRKPVKPAALRALLGALLAAARPAPTGAKVDEAALSNGAG